MNGAFQKRLPGIGADTIFRSTSLPTVNVSADLPCPNQKVEASVTSLLNGIQRASDLASLDLHHGRAGAYLAALRDLEVLAREDLDGVFLVLDRLYQAQFSRLGMLGAL